MRGIEHRLFIIFLPPERGYIKSIFFVFEEDIFDLRGYIMLGEDIFCWKHYTW
jgi:hypothetical protein